jgi:hypothetical protein
VKFGTSNVPLEKVQWVRNELVPNDRKKSILRRRATRPGSIGKVITAATQSKRLYGHSGEFGFGDFSLKRRQWLLPPISPEATPKSAARSSRLAELNSSNLDFVRVSVLPPPDAPQRYMVQMLEFHGFSILFEGRKKRDQTDATASSQKSFWSDFTG